MNDPRDIMGMTAHLDGDTFLKRLSDENIQWMRNYIAQLIQWRFGKKATEEAIDLGLEMYAQGVDDTGGSFFLQLKRHEKRARKIARSN